MLFVDRMGLAVTSRRGRRGTVVALDGEVDAYTCGRVTAALEETGRHSLEA